MTGTLLNAGAIILGAAIGSFAGSRLSSGMRRIVLYGIGLVTLLIGFQMALRTRNILIVLGAMLIGGIIGEALGIEERLERFGQSLQAKISGDSSTLFAEGFISASLVFCVGPMAILGSISDGLSGDYSLLSVKAVLDGFASIAFAATFGWGVGLSSVCVFIYQGAITLFAGSLSGVMSEAMIAEMTATGGLVIVGIGIKLLDLKDLPLANFVPAIAVVPLVAATVQFVGTLF